MTHALKVVHRTNWLLAALESEDFAALEPHLEGVELTLKQVLYEAGDPIRHAYFPHHAVVSLVNVLEDGTTVEVALFGRGGVVGLLLPKSTRATLPLIRASILNRNLLARFASSAAPLPLRV
ncbi:Crp/Fnr family transcriptional regulator [Microvirga zambiensis]|uniref:Crp/Fnr family transcriptional regulator n=1 Tax=Microvirga zambiensis TaxID=1402137 RepID=UPI00191CBE36|nr:cyclic nucleotide-binding domain-containing protein [Microvirga zambiensis]